MAGQGTERSRETEDTQGLIYAREVRRNGGAVFRGPVAALPP